MTGAPEGQKSFDAALMSIGFLMDMTDRMLWRCGGGRGPWEGCLAALVLAREPGLKTRRLVEALPAEKHMDRVGLLNTMANLGYYSEGIRRVPLRDVEPRLLPCLFISSAAPDTPLAVLARDDDSVTVYDGAAHAMRRLALAEARMQGEICFFRPYDGNRQKTSKFMRAGFGRSWFAAVVRRFSGTTGQILVTCLALNIFALAPALFVMMVYDRVISPSDLSVLPALVAGVGLALAAEHILRDVRSEGLAWMTARLDNLVGARIFSHLIGLAPDMIERASVAAQVARVKTFESVRDFFSSAVFLSFLEIPFVILAAGVMWAVAGPLVFVPVAMVAAYVALFAVMRHYIKGAIRLAAKASSARQQFTMETFEKLRFVRTSGLAAVWGGKFAELQGREVLMSFHLGFLGTIAETLANALTVLAAVFTIGVGAHLVWAGEASMGALVASMILVWRILLPFYSLCTMIPRLEQLRNSIMQVNTLMDMETEAETGATAVLPRIKGHVRVEDASFSYDEKNAPVLEGLELDLMPGRIVAVTGRNGSGKTTLLKMVKGLYRPRGGMVRIDGFDIRQLGPQALRRQIAYVPQRAEFFPGTIAENIVIGNILAKPEDVEAALVRADAWDEVSALPQGMHTPVEDCAISPLLAARLSLARAYVHDAPLLLLDELPNAVLNGAAGKNLKQYLQDGKGRRSVILVTHRSDFLELADSAVHLRRGAAPRTAEGEDVALILKEAA